MTQISLFDPESLPEFVARHIGPSTLEISEMLDQLGMKNLEEFIDQVIPPQIRLKRDLHVGEGVSEALVLEELAELASKNQVFKNYIGMGYSNCYTPSVILRNILENPGWYTQYTPYQAEIAQGRLEALLNFQTLITDLTGLPVANASLLDEATAAAEAMYMCHSQAQAHQTTFWVCRRSHPQVIEVVKTRAQALNIKVQVGDLESADWKEVMGALLPNPTTDGEILDYTATIESLHQHGALAVMTADLLSLVLVKSPGSMGADICVGNAQRFGVPLGFGGPHAAFMATRDELKRKMPGRLVGVSRDAEGRMAVRLALQTREQHIRREKATSNICTAQVLLAIISSMYAIYHGPKGLKKIALDIHKKTKALKEALLQVGVQVSEGIFFDTLRILIDQNLSQKIVNLSQNRAMNFRLFDDQSLGISLDETTTHKDVNQIIQVFCDVLGKNRPDMPVASSQESGVSSFPPSLTREDAILLHPVFNTHHSETEMLRYMHSLETRDLSLNKSMIPLGSCTMKLNATTEMIPVTWKNFGALHPFVPASQVPGYREMTDQLEGWLSEITGFAAVSLQPNAGSQGEYAGLLVIRKYHESRGEGHRHICLIPSSAHGTNPASAVLAGMEVVVVKCDKNGNIDLDDLKQKAEKYSQQLSCLMVTYPSTHGVFEDSIIDICDLIHQQGGQVYMDGANMNAQVGLCRPGDFGADVCHLNLHKTFCIPHGGGGPGMGPIGVASHLKDFLPNHPLMEVGGSQGIGPVSAAPYGSASILPIPYAYIRMMGSRGLKRATEVAILNANYMAHRLEKHYPVLYRGKNGFVAHECILDLRPLKTATGVEVEDVAKRLMDYGFHAPTVSFPVPGTLMIEPTESESKAELDRFCEAMISIRHEIQKIEEGIFPKDINPLKMAPHTATTIISANWDRPYSREEAVFPLSWVRDNKFWPSVSRIDNTFGDRNFFCTCPPLVAE